MQSLNNVLLGIAVADAIGNPLEFHSKVTNADVARVANTSKVLRVSDDTQMSLFCAEALNETGDAVHRVEVNLIRGYLRWYSTQRHQASQGGATGLLSFKSLYLIEAPGRTCMGSLAAISLGATVKNDSKGNGTAMRCVPIAYWALRHGIPLEDSMDWAKLDAELTHKHPYAAQTSAVLVGLHYLIHSGATLPKAMSEVIGCLGKSLAPYLRELFIGSLKPKNFPDAKLSMGGWVAEQALALALGAITCNDNYYDVVCDAVTISGDSDTVGGIAGGLAASLGMPAPDKYVRKLNVLDAIQHVTS